MIVNPQLFNYRLIIGSLIVALAVLTAFSISSYQSLSAHQEFLDQEKSLVQSELTELLNQYEDVSTKNKSLSNELEAAKSDIQSTLDSLEILKGNIETLSKYKVQLRAIKAENKRLFSRIDSINTVNQQLKEERAFAMAELKEQQDANQDLTEKNQLLNSTIVRGSLISANSFRAEAYSVKLGKRSTTTQAKKTKHIEVCFTLAENALATKGFKEIYIQILDPRNNVVADKGAINFGKSSLIYSTKSMINYENTVKDICVDVMADSSDQPLLPGNYQVSIFHKDRKLGSTQVRLY